MGFSFKDNKLEVFIFGTFTIFGVVFMLFAFDMQFSFDKTRTTIEEGFDSINKYIEQVEYLMDNAIEEVTNVKVADKFITKNEYSSYSYTNVIMTPTVIIPSTYSFPSYCHKYYYVNVVLEDGISKTLCVSGSEYDSISIGDSLEVSVYRNDEKLKLIPSSSDNIVSIKVN